jgi:ABC-type antimicrobial peptide transport system permease subunit
VVRLVVNQAVSFAGVGVALGMLGALAVSRWVAPLLFGESPRDPLVYMVVAAVIGAVSLIASAGPALRATRADPNAALRAN